MPQYRPGKDDAAWQELRRGLLEFAARGPFDANDALRFAVENGLTHNAGDVAAMLGDLADLGELERGATGRTEGGGAERFKLAPPSDP